MSSRGSRSGLARNTILRAQLNGRELQPTMNTSLLFSSNVPSSWTEDFLAFTVPAAVLEPAKGPSMLTLLALEHPGGTKSGRGHRDSHLVHMDLQLPASLSGAGDDLV